MNSIDHDAPVLSVPELGAVEAWQALFLLPAGYTDLSRLITDFSRLEGMRGPALVKGRVVNVYGLKKDRTPTQSPFPDILVMLLSDGQREVPCEAFRASAWKTVEPGVDITVLCTVKNFPDTGLCLSAPERERCRKEPRPDYKGIPGKVAGMRVMAAAAAAVMNPQCVRQACRWLTAERPQLARLVAKHWGSLETLFQAIHAPVSMKQGVAALDIARRLCAAEVRLRSRIQRKSLLPVTPMPELRRAVWDAICTQPETFSAGQMKALQQAMPALCGDRAARILLNGDVGSGKTLVFLCIVAGFCALGQRCAIMAPNGNVARQLYANATRRFPALACRYVADGGAEGSDDPLLWIGTTALLHVEKMPELACLVVDEQQKFSRQQREALLGGGTHLIEATATPIPRTMTLALFTDCVNAEIAVPPVHRKIRSHLLVNGERHLVQDLHRQTIARGKKVVYLYAAVVKSKARSKAKKEPEKVESKSAEPTPGPENVRGAETAFAEMNARFPGQVALVHGKMPAKKAAEQLQRFQDGISPILISTTAIEVGVDVPGIALLVVNDPDRFGINQLHQIRGRIARDGGEGDFVMISAKELSKHAFERLKVVRNESNGFELARKDLELRGFGEVAGDLQTGAAETTFKLSQLSARDFVARPQTTAPHPMRQTPDQSFATVPHAL